MAEFLRIQLRGSSGTVKKEGDPPPGGQPELRVLDHQTSYRAGKRRAAGVVSEPRELALAVATGLGASAQRGPFGNERLDVDGVALGDRARDRIVYSVRLFNTYFWSPWIFLW